MISQLMSYICLIWNGDATEEFRLQRRQRKSRLPQISQFAKHHHRTFYPSKFIPYVITVLHSSVVGFAMRFPLRAMKIEAHNLNGCQKINCSKKACELERTLEAQFPPDNFLMHAHSKKKCYFVQALSHSELSLAG